MADQARWDPKTGQWKTGREEGSPKPGGSSTTTKPPAYTPQAEQKKQDEQDAKDFEAETGEKPSYTNSAKYTEWKKKRQQKKMTPPPAKPASPGISAIPTPKP